MLCIDTVLATTKHCFYHLASNHKKFQLQSSVSVCCCHCYSIYASHHRKLTLNDVVQTNELFVIAWQKFKVNSVCCKIQRNFIHKLKLEYSLETALCVCVLFKTTTMALKIKNRCLLQIIFAWLEPLITGIMLIIGIVNHPWSKQNEASLAMDKLFKLVFQAKERPHLKGRQLHPSSYRLDN